MARFNVSNCAEFNSEFNSELNSEFNSELNSHDVKKNDLLFTPSNSHVKNDIQNLDKNSVKQLIDIKNILTNLYEDNKILIEKISFLDQLIKNNNPSTLHLHLKIDNSEDELVSDYSDNEDVCSDYSDDEDDFVSVSNSLFTRDNRLRIKGIVTDLYNSFCSNESSKEAASSDESSKGFANCKEEHKPIEELFVMLEDECDLESSALSKQFKNYHTDKNYNKLFANFLTTNKIDIKILANDNFVSQHLDNNFWIEIMKLKNILTIGYYEEYCQKFKKQVDQKVLLNNLIMHPNNIYKIHSILQNMNIIKPNILTFFETAVDNNTELLKYLFDKMSISYMQQNVTFSLVSPETNPLDTKYNKECIKRSINSSAHNITYIIDHFQEYIQRNIKIVSIIDDKEIILNIVKSNPEALQYVKEEFKNDKEFILKVVYNNAMALEYVKEEFKNDKEFILKVVDNNGLALQYVKNEAFLKSRKVVYHAIKQNGMALEFAKSFQDREDICKLAVTQNGMALEFVNLLQPKYNEICELAIKQDSKSQQFIKKS